MSLSKEQIIAAEDRKVEKVSVPEWGGHVYVRVMSGSERDSWEASMTRIVGDKAIPVLDNARAKLLVRTLADKEGKRLFTDAEMINLAGKSGAVLDRLMDISRQVNELGEPEKKGSDQSGDSGSG